MNTQNVSPELPRKELVGRLQKGVFGLLFLLLLSFVGLFFVMNSTIEKHKIQQTKLNDLVSVVHHAEEHWLEWLLIEDRQLYDEGSLGHSSSHLHQVLTGEYQLIEQDLMMFESLSGDEIAGAKVLLDSLSHKFLLPLSEDDRTSIYYAIEVLERLGDELSEMSVIYEYERQVFVEKLIWWPIGAFALLAFFIVYWAASYVRQMRSGIADLHNIVDRHKHSIVGAHRSCIDEFTHLGYMLDNELETQGFDLALTAANLKLLEIVFSSIEEPFFVTNDVGDVAWMSAGAERLWISNSAAFEPVLGIYSGVDTPVGERVVDSVLLSDKETIVKLSSGVYGVKVNRLSGAPDSEEESLRSIIVLESKSEEAELKILHNSLQLIEKDIWTAPIRILRSDSPYVSFSQSLESIRRNVVELFEEVNNVLGDDNIEEVTKLQQIPFLMSQKIYQTEGLDDELIPQSDALVVCQDIHPELNSVADVSEQVRDSLLLGYELVLKRLQLVEKDLSSDVVLLNDVERWLNEVRVGVLSSLSATEGESANVRRRFSVDLEHDISKVQTQIEEMRAVAESSLSSLQSDRTIGSERLDLARESINEMVDKVQEIMDKTTPQVEGDSLQLLEGSRGE
ncbi:hypothetical protein OFY17_00715 [Marinomonas sp. C2222]|uniref:Uncharacterized protein n=1 Tax=Marinomonas sargassi TaxID=2984494 RepID=A0ABT2YNC3_9GAMM|nr:hypothetical protein [Marinomonas sargassi]MCV2401391.1 hypothetical protein [Marinomonas sargassi]